MYILIRIESERRLSVADGGAGMYFKKLGYHRVFQSLHISLIPVSEQAAIVYNGNLLQSHIKYRNSRLELRFQKLCVV